MSRALSRPVSRPRLRQRINASPDHRSVVVYALLDHDRRPIYIGSTQSLANRLTTHRIEQPWWHEVAFATWLEVPFDRTSRWNAERRAIGALSPQYNRTCIVPASVAATGLAHARRSVQLQNEEPTVRLLCDDPARWIVALADRDFSGHAFVVASPGPITRWKRPQ